MKLNVSVLGLLLLAGNRPALGSEEAGWYSFEFPTGGSLVARLTQVEGDSYLFLYQGVILRVEKGDLKALRPIRSPEDPSKDSEAPAPTSGRGQPTAEKKSTVAEEQLRDAIEQLVIIDGPNFKKAYQLLSANFPKARDLLHDALPHPSPIVRGRVVKLLGERGAAREDLQAVSGRLNDPQPDVRITAVLAVRTLGPDGAAALRGFLANETVPNNLKMAIKTLHLWKDAQSVAPLVACMERVNDQTVREFAERALEHLTGLKLGTEPEAWRTWLTDVENKREEEKVLRSGELEARRLEIQAAKALEKASADGAARD